MAPSLLLGRRLKSSCSTFPATCLAGWEPPAWPSAEWIGADTAGDLDFFSNRRAFKVGDPDYGRLASAIVLAR